MRKQYIEVINGLLKVDQRKQMTIFLKVNFCLHNENFKYHISQEKLKKGININNNPHHLQDFNSWKLVLYIEKVIIILTSFEFDQEESELSRKHTN